MLLHFQELADEPPWILGGSGKTDRKAGMELVGDPNQNSPSLGRKAHIEILSFFFPCGFTVLSTVQGTRLVLSASSSGRRGKDPTSLFVSVLGKMVFPVP